MLNLTRRRFLNWLWSQKGYIGDPESANDCPICRYYKDHGAKEVYVDYEGREIDGRYETNRKWMTRFQERAVKIADVAEVQEIDVGTAYLIALHL